MDATLVQYGIFIVVALVLIWAVIAFNRRLSRQGRSGSDILKTWAKLDTRHTDPNEQRAATFDDEDEEIAQLHARASQNGHHAESQK
jgi:hypothetical protein